MTTTPYLAIVADIRDRIASGQLRTGDKVPSTRQLVRDWGVAIATATRALSTLQSEGLVRAVVGVGTVVADRPQGTVLPRPAREAEQELTRERIVRTAVAIADAEGLAVLSMRRLATELDAAVMSLYRHVPSKEDLMVAMVDQVYAEYPPPGPGPTGWRVAAEDMARRMWALCKAHPWLCGVMSLVRPMLVPNGMAVTDESMRVLRDAGLDLPDSLQVTVAIAGLVIGVGISLQLEADAQRDTGMTSEEWMDSHDREFNEVGGAAKFPMLAEVSSVPGFELRLDDVFATGLALMLDGLAQRIESQNRVSSSRSMPRRAS
jgi:DNA-binding transcriptional regulator YhcF (GntR family)